MYAVQGHERGLARAAGDAVLQARDRGSPPQTERAAELKPKEDMKAKSRQRVISMETVQTIITLDSKSIGADLLSCQKFIQQSDLSAGNMKPQSAGY